MITGKIFKRPDGSYVINDGMYHATEETNITISKVEAYLAEHPEALIPEPVPPEPTQEEKDAQRRETIIAMLTEIDLKTARGGRAVALGRATADDIARLTVLDDEAEALRGELRGLI